MNALIARLVGPKRKTKPLHVTFYTRASCSCCEKAMDVLKTYGKQYSLMIETINVDDDPALKAKYDMSVPVVAINGRERFRGVVNPALLERVLWSESRGA